MKVGGATTVSAQQFKAERRAADLQRDEKPKGRKFQIPGNDFSRFLGWDKQGRGEGKNSFSPRGSAVLERSIKGAFQQLGKNAVDRRGKQYEAMGDKIGHTTFKATPQNFGRSAGDSMASVKETMEMGQAGAMKYLELQYKLQFGSRSTGIISNLMKKRSETIKAAIGAIR